MNKKSSGNTAPPQKRASKKASTKKASKKKSTARKKTIAPKKNVKKSAKKSATRKRTKGTGKTSSGNKGQNKRKNTSSAGRKEVSKEMLIVALGASAKGLEAYERFFKNMPGDSDMAFVLIQHLDPTYESKLTELVSRYTEMQVQQATDGMNVRSNNVYVIPPNSRMRIEKNKLRLEELDKKKGRKLPIDYFFRSLAEDRGERSVAIVLSGSGNDGALGIKEIKGAGGIVMAQDPKTTEYASMPRAAIDTGLVDFVLAPEAIPEYLINYKNRALLPVSSTETDTPSLEKDTTPRIMELLKKRTGHDFSSYKKNTLDRRIRQRLNINQIEDPDDYLRFINQNPQELDSLFRELLIGVTSFYRDPEGFEALEKEAIPQIIKKKNTDDKLRAWVPGCSTGEEAYSIAFALFEQMEIMGSDCEVQVFATDIDEAAVEKARTGLYPDSIAGDVPQRFLNSYFTKEGPFYRIKNKIRNSVIFAVQNIIKDPPFSNLDLISCRNMLIYMNADLHRKLVPLFHYALNKGGYLFIGPSESLGDTGNLFKQVNRKAKIFKKTGPTPGARPYFEPAAVLARVKNYHRQLPYKKETDITEIARDKLLREFTPAGVVINQEGEIFYFHGSTGRFLEPATGKAELNIFSMAQKKLRVPITNALRKLERDRESEVKERIAFPNVKAPSELIITVKPMEADESEEQLFLVVFDERPTVETTTSKKDIKGTESEKDARIRELEHELASTREYLQTTIEELETSNEELRATNEEYEAANEELQSTNEEHQTSKEELQSVNEELVTVNSELEGKIQELIRTNQDLNNLLSMIEVGTLILDTKLRIKHFSPSMNPIMNLIESDIGRPVSDINTRLEIKSADLESIASQVLDNLDKKEQEVKTNDNGVYHMKVVPFRSTGNVIEGVVMTFVQK